MLVRILPLPGLGLGLVLVEVVVSVEVEVGSVQGTCSRRFRALRVRSRIRNTKDQEQDPVLDLALDLVRTLIIIRRGIMRTSRLRLLRGGIVGLGERWAGDKARDKARDRDRDKDMVAGRTGMEKGMVGVVIITTITIIINSSITIG